MRISALFFLCLCTLGVWGWLDSCAFSAQEMLASDATISVDSEPTTESTAVEITVPTVITDEPVLGSVTIEPMALPTLTASPQPIISITPTPEFTETPSIAASPVLLTLPIVAKLDDGALNWIPSSGWVLQSHSDGLVWRMQGNSNEVLLWSAWIDLRASTSFIVLSFQTLLSGTGRAVIEFSADGLNWLPAAAVSASPGWTTMTVDMNAFRGSLVQTRFVWQPLEAAAEGEWWIDQIAVTELLPTSSTATSFPDSGLNPDYTPTDYPISDLTPTLSAALPCVLDVDRDGTITEQDLAVIADLAFSSNADTGTNFDWNGNQKIDIGDLQKMAQYRSASCSN